MARRKSMSRRRNSVRVNIRTKRNKQLKRTKRNKQLKRTKRNKQTKRMKKTKRMKRNNYEKRGGCSFCGGPPDERKKSNSNTVTLEQANNLQLAICFMMFNGEGRYGLNNIVGNKWDENGEGTTRTKLLQFLRSNKAPRIYNRNEITPNPGETDGVVDITNDEEYRTFISSSIFD